MTGTLRISYVEDEPDIRAVTELALRTLGNFELDVCASGEEAVKRIPGFRPDLILLDVMMPGMTGPDVISTLRESGRLGETPFVFMTAKVQSADIAEYRDMGAVDVIPKPFDPMTLPERIRGTWDTWRQTMAEVAS